MQDLRDLIRKLLVHNPARRLGFAKNGAVGVKEHPWFAGFDWDSFAKRTMQAPYIPQVHRPVAAEACGSVIVNSRLRMITTES